MAVTIHADMYEAAKLYEDPAGLLFALVEYAETGEEPDRTAPWYPTFVAFRERVRMSAEAHANGRKGGRPRVQNPSAEGFETPCGKGFETPSGNPSEKGLSTNINKDKKSRDDDIEEVIAHLNERCGTSYSPKSKANRQVVGARLDEYPASDLIKAIDNMASLWLGTEMERYLRPETLFRQSKFEGYLNTKPKAGDEYDRAMQSKMKVVAG